RFRGVHMWENKQSMEGFEADNRFNAALSHPHLDELTATNFGVLERHMHVVGCLTGTRLGHRRPAPDRTPHVPNGSRRRAPQLKAEGVVLPPGSDRDGRGRSGLQRE